MKGLREHLTEYLALRRGLGFKTARSRWLLTNFVSFLEAKPCAFITSDTALEWARQPVGAHPAWWAQKLSTVRVFAKHIHLADPRNEIPPRSLLPAKMLRTTPTLYSADEITRVLRAARKLESPFRSATYETLFGLLAATGMRVGEAINLNRKDVDWKEQVLVVREAKFRKSREVVLHSTVVSALRRYAAKRERFHRGIGSDAFFVSLSGTRLIYNNVHQTFARVLCSAGISREKARLHDLRHTYAVATILRWHRDGENVEARLPRLSTYLGHASPSSTYWYLTASPELMALVGQKLERALGKLP